jgi:hypothetical protein
VIGYGSIISLLLNSFVIIIVCKAGRSFMYFFFAKKADCVSPMWVFMEFFGYYSLGYIA